MTLSKIERQMLLNQFLILAKLDPNEAESYSRYAKSLAEGYTADYDFLGYLSDELDVDQCNFVYAVLGMYQSLSSSWELLSNKDGITLASVTYRGFDGNNETQHMGYSRFVVEDCKKFTYLGIADHNSHMEMIPAYELMLEQLKKYNNPRTLTAVKIKEVTHASDRKE